MDAHCGVAYCIQLVEINLCMIRVICSTFNGFFSSDVHTDIRPFAFWLQNVLIRFASSAHSTESIHFWTDAFAGFLHMPMNLWRASNPKKKNTHTSQMRRLLPFLLICLAYNIMPKWNVRKISISCFLPPFLLVALS